MLISHSLPVFGKYGFLSALDSERRIKLRKLVGTWECQMRERGNCEDTDSPPWQEAFAIQPQCPQPAKDLVSTWLSSHLTFALFPLETARYCIKILICAHWLLPRKEDQEKQGQMSVFAYLLVKEETSGEWGWLTDWCGVG